MNTPVHDLTDNEVDVMPTKALFVDMLTRDIPIDRAVIDLVDNCVDGARRIRGDGSLAGLEVRIQLDRTKFSITDNCGGISIETAKKYAFRFGRPAGMSTTPGSVGQFGVGMKRALFKFGRDFRVESTTETETFAVAVDVEQWKNEGRWTFSFEHTQKGLQIPVEATGTTISVTNLHENVTSAFADARFRISLGRQLEAAQQHYLSLGLQIFFDGQALISTPWSLLVGGGLNPIHTEERIIRDGQEPILIRLFAGVFNSDPKAAGWYVVCNGRTLLEADQSAATGWSDIAETGQLAIPKFHNQFARFRGFVFFDCQDTSLLPWNTTKTGVDKDNAVFAATRLKMMQATRPVIDFLNDVDKEKEYSDADLVLARSLSASQARPLREIAIRETFGRPPSVRASPTISIQFRREKEKTEALQAAFGVTSARAAGERSFDYAFDKLVGED